MRAERAAQRLIANTMPPDQQLPLLSNNPSVSQQQVVTDAHSNGSSFSNHVESQLTVQDATRDLHVQFADPALQNPQNQSTMAFLDPHADELNAPLETPRQDVRKPQAAHRRSSTVNAQQYSATEASNIDLSPVESIPPSVQLGLAASIPNQSHSVEIVEVEQQTQTVAQIKQLDSAPVIQSQTAGPLTKGLSLPTGPGTLPVPGPPDPMPPRGVEFSLMSGNFGRNNNRRDFNNFNPNFQYRGNFRNSNFRGRGHFSNAYDNNFDSMNNHGIRMAPPPDAFQYYDYYASQGINPPVNAQNLPPIQPLMANPITQMPVSVSVVNPTVLTSAASLNVPSVMNSVAGGGLSTQGMTQPSASMTIATNPTQAALAPVQSTSIAVTIKHLDRVNRLNQISSR